MAGEHSGGGSDRQHRIGAEVRSRGAGGVRGFRGAHADHDHQLPVALAGVGAARWHMVASGWQEQPRQARLRARAQRPAGPCTRGQDRPLPLLSQQTVITQIRSQSKTRPFLNHSFSGSVENNTAMSYMYTTLRNHYSIHGKGFGGGLAHRQHCGASLVSVYLISY